MTDFLCACIIYRENNPISGIITEFYFIAISLFVFECFVLWTYIHNLQMNAVYWMKLTVIPETHLKTVEISEHPLEGGMILVA